MNECDYCIHVEMCGWRKELEERGCDFFDDGNKWIPVSERLPEEHEWIGTKRFGTTISDEVYITFETMDGERFCYHDKLENGKLSPAKQLTIDAISKGAKMVAWMPLPEPYKAESEG